MLQIFLSVFGVIKFSVFHIYLPHFLKYCICVLREADLLAMAQKILTCNSEVIYYCAGAGLSFPPAQSSVRSFG